MTTTSSSNFWVEFNSRVPRLESALRNNDGETLTRLVDELAAHLFPFDHRLNLNVYGPNPFRIGILAMPGAEPIAEAFVEANSAPSNWSVDVGLPDDDLKAVVVQDDFGASLRIAYGDLLSTVLVDKDGQATIVLALDHDFDPAGAQGHLYQAAADNVVTTLLGGSPSELKCSVLLPLSSVGPAKMQPVHTLREQWLEALDAITKRCS